MYVPVSKQFSNNKNNSNILTSIYGAEPRAQNCRSNILHQKLKGLHEVMFLVLLPRPKKNCKDFVGMESYGGLGGCAEDHRHNYNDFHGALAGYLSGSELRQSVETAPSRRTFIFNLFCRPGLLRFSLLNG